MGGFAFLGVDEVGIDLGGRDILVGQHLETARYLFLRELEYRVCVSEAAKVMCLVIPATNPPL